MIYRETKKRNQNNSSKTIKMYMKAYVVDSFENKTKFKQ